jgi:hypothetical protein
MREQPNTSEIAHNLVSDNLSLSDIRSEGKEESSSSRSFLLVSRYGHAISGSGSGAT